MVIEKFSKENKNKFFKILLLLTLVGLPFNDLPFYSMKGILGGLYPEGSLYVIYLAIIFCILHMMKNKKIVIPNNNSIKIIFIFIIINVVAGILNYNNIMNSYSKGISGISRYLNQILVLILCFMFSIIVYYICTISNMSFIKIRKYILISFLIVAFYSIIEILSMYGISFATSIMSFVNNYIHGSNGSITYIGRIRSVSTEASALSIYLSFIFPWLFTYVLQRKRKILYIFLIIFFLIILLLSRSRTGYFTILVEFIIFLCLFFKFSKKIKNKLILLSSFIIIVISLFVITSIINSDSLNSNSSNSNPLDIINIFTSINDDSNVSNVTRIGSQKAAIKIGLDHPIIGVGNGQYGFYSPQYYDLNTLMSPEIQNWIYSTDQKLPPSYGLVVRIFCENGTFGLFTWFCLFISILRTSLSILKKNPNDSFTICIIVSVIGMFIVQFDCEAFSFMELWMTLGLYWYLIKKSPTY